MSSVDVFQLLKIVFFFVLLFVGLFLFGKLLSLYYFKKSARILALAGDAFKAQAWSLETMTRYSKGIASTTSFYKNKNLDIKLSVSQTNTKDRYFIITVAPHMIPHKIPSLKFVLSYPKITENFIFNGEHVVGSFGFSILDVENSTSFLDKLIQFRDEAISAVEKVERGDYKI